MNNIATMITKNSITVNFDGSTHTVLATDTNTFEKLKQAIKDKDETLVRSLASKPAHIEKSSGGACQVKDGVVYVDGTEVPGQLGRQLCDFANEGLPFEPLVNFCRKLRQNPSHRAVNQLFGFLEKWGHPITEDGDFIAYKKVHGPDAQGRMLDIHSKTFDNSPGKVVEMPRNQVNEDPNVYCSTGLHVANWDYAANSYGSPTDTMLEVAVSPANVVAIPLDYAEAKMRVCRYEVRAVVTNPNGNKHLVVDPKPVASLEEDESFYPKCDRTGNPCDKVKSCGLCVEDEETEDEDDYCETCEEYDCHHNNEPEPEDEDVEEEVPSFSLASDESLRKMSTSRLSSYETRLKAHMKEWSKIMYDFDLDECKSSLKQTRAILKRRNG